MLEVFIQKRRRRFTVDATFEVSAGESVGLFGPSGAGKSTVLSCIAGIASPDSGVVRWNGVEMLGLPPYRRPFGYLTQDALLFPHLSAGANIAFGLTPASAAHSLLEQIKEEFALRDLWRLRPGELSGGQAQRVAMARMLARAPRVVLLDEPFFGLDRIVVRELIGSLRRWIAQHKCAMIVVDHQEQVLRALCPFVNVMAEGRIVQRGSWDDVSRAPADPAVAALLRPL